MLQNKTIFFSALDWGLGHATRCVLIIRDLQKNNKIIIGITPLTKTIFEEEFPELEKINIPPYNITYSSFLPLWFKLMLQWPKISTALKTENKLLAEIIKTHKIDYVISDNRLGLFSKNVHSVLITHQLFLKSPFANRLAQSINKKYIQNFNEVWVPDFESEEKSLSGDLSHGKHFHPNVKYIGPQSRLNKTKTQKKYDYLFLLSGPEPQQTILKNKLIKLAENNSTLKFALISPRPTIKETKNIETFFCPDKIKIGELLAQSEVIFCRSGYSSLMDLHALNKKNIILIPTPGQTEQEYLAEYWSKKFGSKTLSQNKISTFNF